MKTRINNFISGVFILLGLIYSCNIISQQLLLQEVFNKTDGSVLQLKAFDSDRVILGTGSAVAVGNEGLIYTNMHIYEDAFYFEISSGNKIVHDVKIVGFNPGYDILIFKIPAGLIKGVPVANSDSVIIGEVCYALGNPQGYINTFSSGIISGIRYNPEKQIQYTASISPGSSGGALLNSNGELLGITSSTVKSGQNLNFAVPVNYFVNTGTVNYDDSVQCKLISELVKLNNSASLLSGDLLVRKLNEFDSITSGNRNSLYTSAGLYAKAGYYEKVLNECDYGLAKYPNDKEFYLLRANANRSLKNKSEAINDYNSALEIDSNYENALIDKSNFFTIDSNNYSEALNCLQKIVNSITGREYLYINIAQLYLDSKDTLNAYASLERSYQYAFPLIGEYFEQRAWLFERMEKYEEAVWDYTSAINLNPDKQSNYFSRAILYSKMDRPDKALNEYQKVLNFNPVDIYALNNLAYTYFNLSDFENAEKYFEKSISLHSDHFDSYIGLSITFKKLNQLKRCLQTMSKAINIMPALKLGIAGLDKLSKSGYFWTGKERLTIKDVFVKMGYESEPSFADDDSDAGVSKPRQILLKNSDKR